MTSATPDTLSRTLQRVAGGYAGDHTPDGELLRRFIDQRDHGAFATLARRHGGMVFGTCRRVLGNAADADDAAQAAFIVLIRKAASLADRECVGGFLHGVAYRTALKARSMSTKRRHREAQARQPTPKDPSDDEALAALDQELARLPDRYREPVVLCELEGLSRRVAAAKLGVPEGTISSRLATAHRMLARRLKLQGFASAGGFSVLSILGSPRKVISQAQAMSLARSAATSPSHVVSQLATEVTKMLLLEKLRAAGMLAVAVAFAMVMVIGLTPRNPVSAGDPEAKVIPPKKQADPKPKQAPIEPAWKQAFRDKYGLKDGEHIKRIALPYPECRADYMRERLGGAGGKTPLDEHFTVLRWRNDWAPPELAKHTLPVKSDEGIALGRLLDMVCGMPRTRIEDPDNLLEDKVTGDFVVRDESSPEKIAEQFSAILKKECKVEVAFRFQEVEREVFVLSGKYEAKPLEGRAKTEVEIFGISVYDRRTGGGGTGTFDEMLEHVERHISQCVVAGKIEGAPGRISWHYNVRSPMVKDPANGIDTYAEDTNAAAVMNNLADQTGLKLTTEKHKVKVLRVERANMKK
jgi:RNA polymerase sigma factor (sigma-70 family)